MTVAAKLTPSPEVLDLWRNAQAVCFDVDSTFCSDESIDEIAAYLGVGDQVAALTAKAMGGAVKFQDALAERLNLMNCSRQQLDSFLKAHPPQYSPGIPELVAKLQQEGKAVFLVSGGFRQVIHPIAEALGIPLSHVYANQLLFKEDGSYAGFDAEEFTSRSGGKAEAVRDIKVKFGYQRIVAVGDGATDMEARQPDAANIFIGYGGVVERLNIAAQADWYVYDIHVLLEALQ
uniref:phosphoserine phosphatase n=1 Tax=Tetradesmus obliquus TaxID=3088 RepID=A0A383WPI7_TETOB|eukprot:jgi/Sobl393_1/8945/SZX79355.1